MSNVKTVILTGGETAVKFGDSCPCVMVTNMGDSEVYVSSNSGITPYADGVYTVLPGVEICIHTKSSCDTVYLLGSGTVQVRAEDTVVPVSFNLAAKGGDSGGSVDLSEYAKKEDIPDVSEFVSNPDNLNIMVVKNSAGSTINSSVFAFADYVQIGTNFPLLNKLPNGESRQNIGVDIPSVSQSRAGVMTAADKAKLDSITPEMIEKLKNL